MQIESFFDPATHTASHLLLDTASGQCAVVDPVLDYDARSGRTRTHSADRLIQRVRELGARLAWILETHVHADHLSAAPVLQQELGGQVGIGRHVLQVRQHFERLFPSADDANLGKPPFDHLFDDGDIFHIGAVAVQALHTPGHTPACMSYCVQTQPGAVFVGDTLFMPDHGTARCDFPGGDAQTLWHSVQRLLQLPPDTVLYMCHDYQPGGRDLRLSCTVQEQREHNVHVHQGIEMADFVQMRRTRDATLEVPTLLLPSLQVNLRGGVLPPAQVNGLRYLKIPLNAI